MASTLLGRLGELKKVEQRMRNIDTIAGGNPDQLTLRTGVRQRIEILRIYNVCPGLEHIRADRACIVEELRTLVSNENMYPLLAHEVKDYLQ